MKGRSQQSKTRARGFTLLYAMLVISVVILVTSSLFSILLKEMRLASFGEASQIAYYAAETGAECAFYWALQGVTFTGTGSIQCAGDTITPTTPFTVNIGSAGCAIVTYEVDGGVTTIQSRGYNLCPGVGASSRRVERGIQVVF